MQLVLFLAEESHSELNGESRTVFYTPINYKEGILKSSSNDFQIFLQRAIDRMITVLTQSAIF